MIKKSIHRYKINCLTASLRLSNIHICNNLSGNFKKVQEVFLYRGDFWIDSLLSD